MVIFTAMGEDKYEVVIGLEVHAQLLTETKLFCSDLTRFGAAPNTRVSPVSLAHPGTLPVLNRKAVELAVKLGLALDCDIQSNHFFARKNYFYPDLPKGYQVSQHLHPICKAGNVGINVNGIQKSVMLNRIHIEEDAGKSLHDVHPGYSSIDLNRAGVPLLEIVTEPCIQSAEEAYQFLTELRRMLRWLDVCDGNMEEGSMRCDANISIRLKGETYLGTRVEVKNLNSIRNVKKAIELEFSRLVKLVENNETIIQQTRSYNADTNTTFSLRNKEDAEDYRYFPEPDLPKLSVSRDYIAKVKTELPVLPTALEKQYQENYGLSSYDAAVLCSDRDDAWYYNEVATHTTHYKSAANWMLGPIKSYCNNHTITTSSFPLPAGTIAALVNLTEEGKISFQNASGKIMQQMIADKLDDPLAAASQLNLLQDSGDDALLEWVNEVISAMPQQVTAYKSGKKNLLGLFAGEVKKRSKGKADMKKASQMLEEKLNS